MALLKDGDVKVMKLAADFEPVSAEELQDMMNSEKKAISDAYQKYKILEAWVMLINTMCEAELQRKYNAGKHNPLELHKFKVAVLRYFSMIRFMIIEQKPLKKMTVDEKRKYDDLVVLALKESDSSWKELFAMQEYLLEKSHDLNLTNLLVSPKNPMA